MICFEYADDKVVPPVVKKVAVVSGGWSHEANLNASPHVLAAIGRLGLEAVHLDYRSPDFLREVCDPAIDLIFPQTLGAYGEDGTLQGLLDYLGRPYVGSGPMASAICANKLVCSLFIRGLGLYGMANGPEGVLLSAQHKKSHAHLAGRLGTPFVLKPLATGASFGLRLIASAQQYEACVEELIAEFDCMLAEPFCRGDEYSVGLLQVGQDMLALPPAFVRSNVDGSLFDLQRKVEQNHASREVEAGLSRRLREFASVAAQALGICGLARMDLIVDQTGRLHFLELNTLPGLLPGLCLFPTMCDAAGIEYERMVRMAIDSALQPKPMQMRKLACPPARPAELDRFFPAHDTSVQTAAA